MTDDIMLRVGYALFFMVFIGGLLWGISIATNRSSTKRLQKGEYYGLILRCHNDYLKDNTTRNQKSLYLLICSVILFAAVSDIFQNTPIIFLFIAAILICGLDLILGRSLWFTEDEP